MNILAVLAHPDDEAFGISGTIKCLTNAGHTVSFIETTDGSAGQVHPLASGKLKVLGSVKALRRQELRESAAILGVTNIHYLDYSDGSLNNQHIFDNDLVEKIKEIIVKEKPEVVLAYDHTGISLHLDHIATSLAASKAAYECRDIVDKVFLFVAPEEYKPRYPYVYYVPFPATHVVDISQVVTFKEKSIKAHQSQGYDWERFFEKENNTALQEERFFLSQDRGRNKNIFAIFKEL
ncbi:MAG: PIG-L deacetylase family protein [Patescibacteria group bacterium]|jgi:LmbE family N-acetylglucosaminyl deacetylase